MRLTYWVSFGFALSACGIQGELTSATTSASTTLPSVALISTARARPSEDLLLSIATVSPEFSGYYCDSGDLIVGAVTSPADPASIALQQLVADKNVEYQCHNRDFPNHDPEIVLTQKKYSFVELRGFRDSIQDSYFDNVSGATMLGIDYQNNRLLMGVTTGNAQAAAVEVAGLTKDAGSASSQTGDLANLPADSYSITEVAAPHITSGCPAAPYDGPTTNDCSRPVAAGTQITSCPYNAANISGRAHSVHQTCDRGCLVT